MAPDACYSSQGSNDRTQLVQTPDDLAIQTDEAFSLIPRFRPSAKAELTFTLREPTKSHPGEGSFADLQRMCHNVVLALW